MFAQQCTVQLYADDTVIYFSNKCHIYAKDILQRDLDNLQVWCHKNKLTVNIQKTKSMIFGTAKRIRSLSNLDLKMQNMSLSQVTSYVSGSRTRPVAYLYPTFTKAFQVY